jgi:heme/copper-type cytochrome/quinol oxidase subunit 3
MWVTVILGIVFLCVQGYEYFHAYRDLNLKLSSGVYGSTFFMLTGFHGFHVFVGMLMLLFITLRLHERPLHRRAPFRIRRRRLVLALCGRGLAGPVCPGLLDVS